MEGTRTVHHVQNVRTTTTQLGRQEKKNKKESRIRNQMQGTG